MPNGYTVVCTYVALIKTHGSESQGQEEAACARLQAYVTTTVSYLHVAEL